MCPLHHLTIRTLWQSTGQAIVFYDFVQQNFVRSISVEHAVQSFDVSQDGALIAVGTSDHLVKLVDYQEGNFQVRRTNQKMLR